MSKSEKQQLYCSLDLEFTGFDPSRDQILEIGFAFFKVSEKGLEVTEQWSQVFKPTIEVHPKILGLTGITQEELDNAPEFNEFRELLQDKLGQAIIVGHNPTMDVKFLESYGIRLSGQVVDTLELVQFILPTHHSYNLENLVHYFGIEHHKAHRALGDALSTIQVLENLLQVYARFSDELKAELAAVLRRGEFLWAELLAAPLQQRSLQSNDSLKGKSSKLKPFALADQLITIDTDVYEHEARVALGLKNEQASLVVVNDVNTVMHLWRQGYAHGVFKSEDTFSASAFKKFLKQATSRDELRFCLKIIVWLHTNWQHEVVFDLNISFFGGQFRGDIVGGQPLVKDETVVVTDYATLSSLNKDFKKRLLVICDLQNFEKFISSDYGQRLSWNSVLYSLRLIYNPETDSGDLSVKTEVTNALAATDLFFSLAYMLLHSALPHHHHATLEELRNNHETLYNRLSRAAENLNQKIKLILGHEKELGRVTDYLVGFFTEQPERVKWITIDELNLSMHDQPIDVSPSVKELTKGYANLKFTDTIINFRLLSYLVDRLGLNTETPELFNKSTKPGNFLVEIKPEPLFGNSLYEECKSSDLPLIVVMPEPAAVKDFYNSYYTNLKERAALFAQGYSGGGNKMFRNFSIKVQSILLVTAGFVAKQNYKIYAKTVLFSELPSLDLNHPYVAALIKHWGLEHPDLPEVLKLGLISYVLKKINPKEKVTVKIHGVPENFSLWG